MPDKTNQNEKVAPLDNQATSSSGANGYEYKLIPLDRIDPDPNQPRKDFSGLEGLINSIDYEGLIYPITIAPQSDNPDKYIIIDGERRFRAYKELHDRAIENQELPSKYEIISARILSSFESRIGILLNLMNKGYNSMEIADSLDLL